MFSRQDAGVGLLSLALITVAAGCANSPARQTDSARLAKPRRQTPPAPAAPQAVESAQAPAARPTRPSGIVAAAGQAPGDPIVIPEGPAAVSPGAGGPTLPLSNPLQTTAVSRPTEAPAAPATGVVQGPAQPATIATGESATALRRLYDRAVQRYAAVDSYVYRLQKREQLNGKDQPAEVVMVLFRKQPWSVHMKWIGKEAIGREVVYVKGAFEGKIHTLPAASDPHMFMNGPLISLPPDSLFVRARCRHPITEAGVGCLIDHFGQLLQYQGGRLLQYAGANKRPEYEMPLETVVQEVLPSLEPTMPKGGRRWWFFDPSTGFPVLIVTQDSTSHEVEYYCHDQFVFGPLDDSYFDPARLGKDNARSEPKPR